MSGKTAKVRKSGSAPEGRSPLYGEKSQTLPIQHRKCFGRFHAPLQEEMNNLFNEVFADTKTSGEGADISFPVINITETEKTYDVRVETFGMNPEDLDISTTYNFLTVAGERKGGKDDKACRSFHRTFSLPETADTGKAKASFQSGILNIKIPKTVSKPRHQTRKE